MPGYVKIWTTILADEKFLSLTGNQRSIYLQLLLICKDQSDDAQVRFKSYSQAAHAFGADDSTTTRALLKLHSLSLIELDKGVHDVLIITLPNYEYYQGLTVKGMHAEKNKRRKGKCQKNPKKDTRPDQTRPDQTRPDQTRPVGKSPKGDHQTAIDYFCQKYQDTVGAVYAFHGKEDGGKIKNLLSRWSLEQIKCLIDTMFASTNEFYRTGGGYTIGVLLANDNRLVQETKRIYDGTDKLSKAGAATARAAANILERGCKIKTKRLSSPS